LRDVSGVIAGVIVNHDHLKRLEGLGAQTLQQMIQGGFFITGRDQHRHSWFVLQARLGQGDEMAR
jgi:hypothetical protein